MPLVIYVDRDSTVSFPTALEHFCPADHMRIQFMTEDQLSGFRIGRDLYDYAVIEGTVIKDLSSKRFKATPGVSLKDIRSAEHAVKRESGLRRALRALISVHI